MDTSETLFQADSLMNTVRALDAIGPRPATSQSERRAAEYVRAVLEPLDITLEDQFFSSPDSAGALAVPYALLGTIAPLLPGRLGKLIGGAALLAGLSGFRDLLVGKTPPYAAIMAQGVSQNVIARIAPSGPVERRVFLVAHLDTGRLSSVQPSLMAQLIRPFTSGAFILSALTGVVMFGDGVRGKRPPNSIQLLSAFSAGLGLAGLLANEAQPYVEGAGDNASGIAALLAIASALKAQPLEHTEVTFLFTGSAEAGGVGLNDYLERNKPAKDNAIWIDVERVGSGDLTYVNRHGVSLFSDYRPAPKITALANRIAHDNPALGIGGRPNLAVDEVAGLTRRGYEAIAFRGDDRSVQPQAVDPDTLARASRYVWALVQSIDGQS